MRLRLDSLVLVLGMLAGSALAEPAEPARHRIETLHATLLDIMRNATALGFEGRVKKLTPVLEASYSFSDMARIATGSYWRTFNDDQKRKAIRAFALMSIATHASRLVGFTNERFETVGEETLPPPVADVVVRTRIVLSDGGEEKLVYRLHNTGNDWRIVDVFYRETISELATQKAQFLDVLKKGGYDALMKRLEERTHELTTGKALAPTTQTSE